MADVVSKRELIVEEFRKRLAAAFPNSGYIRGLADEEQHTYDTFYVLDYPEVCDMRTRGQYECVFTVGVSYWIQVDPAEIYTIGNGLLERIRLAIETDERLNRLVLAYHMDEGALLWYDKGVLDIEILYVVAYTKDAGWVRTPFKP